MLIDHILKVILIAIGVSLKHARCTKLFIIQLFTPVSVACFHFVSLLSLSLNSSMILSDEETGEFRLGELTHF